MFLIIYLFLFILADIFDQFDEKIGFTQSNVFAVNCGGFGGKRNSDKSIEIIKPPKRKPDVVVVDKTSPDQVNQIFLDTQFVFLFSS